MFHVVAHWKLFLHTLFVLKLSEAEQTFISCSYVAHISIDHACLGDTILSLHDTILIYTKADML